jgi:hypothetical protein
VQVLCRGAIPSSRIIRTRGRGLHKTRPRLRKPTGLIRRRESRGVLAILVAVRITLLRSAQIVKIERLQRQNMVVSEGGGASGYGNFLPTILSVCSSPEWWIDTGANIHVCADISMFSSYQVGGTTSLLTGNSAHARVLGSSTVTLKLTSGETIQLKNVQHVPTIKKNLASGSLLCRDGFKLVFESNKCIISKFGTFVGKGYDSRGFSAFLYCSMITL